MGSPIVRVHDKNSAGGQVIQGHENITVNGRLLAKQGSPVTPHPCCGSPGCGIHCAATAAYPGHERITANGIRILLKFKDVDTCGHVRAEGSPDVVVSE